MFGSLNNRFDALEERLINFVTRDHIPTFSCVKEPTQRLQPEPVPSTVQVPLPGSGQSAAAGPGPRPGPLHHSASDLLSSISDSESETERSSCLPSRATSSASRDRSSRSHPSGAPAGGEAGSRSGFSSPLREESGAQRPSSDPSGDQEASLAPERPLEAGDSSSTELITYDDVLSYIRESNKLPDPSPVQVPKSFSALQRETGEQTSLKPLSFPASPVVVGHTGICQDQVREFTSLKLIPSSTTKEKKFYEYQDSDTSSPLSVSRHLEPMLRSSLDKAKKVSITLSASDLQLVEGLDNCVMQAFSYLDWWVTAVSRLARENLPEGVQTFMARLIKSGVRCLNFGVANAAASRFNIILRHRDAVLSELHSSVSNEDVKALRSSKLPLDSVELFEDSVCRTALDEFHKKSQVEASSKAAQSWRKPSAPWKSQQVRPPQSQAPKGGVSPLVPPTRQPASGSRRGRQRPFRGHSKPARGRGGAKKQA